LGGTASVKGEICAMRNGVFLGLGAIVRAPLTL
jgi:hypothetical protein